MEKTSRRLKVYSTPNGVHSKIIIQGKWLLNFGLGIGDYVEVQQLDNQLVITKTTPPQLDEQVNLKTTVSKQQLDLVKERAEAYHVTTDEVIDKALHYYFKRKKRI